MNEAKPKGSPRDVFLYLALLLTLYVSIFTFVKLMFVYIGYWLQDPFYRTAAYAAMEVRWAIAVLLVVFPALLIVSRIIGQDLARTPEHSELRARKWTFSFVLFTASGTAVGDLVYLTHNFLSGELTSNYVLKSITVLAAASSTFGYYLWDLKNPAMRMAQAKVVPGLVVGVALTSIITGFLIVGTPGYQRSQRFDEDRIYDLKDIVRYARTYYEEKGALPANFDELANFIGAKNLTRDPETKVPYEYKVLAPTSFELCANFKTKPEGASQFSWDPEWKYAPGRTCFTRKAEGRNR